MSCCFESSTHLKTLLNSRMILVKLGTGPEPAISHSIGVNANAWLFHPVSTPSSPLLLESCFLEQVETFGYLGAVLSDDPCWSKHVQSICSKARRLGGSMAFSTEDSTAMFWVATTLLQLYISLVWPHLNYTSAIWSPYLSKDKIGLVNIQKFACRMSIRLWDSSYQDLLLTFQHLNVEGWKLSSVYSTR